MKIRERPGSRLRKSFLRSGFILTGNPLVLRTCTHRTDHVEKLKYCTKSLTALRW